MNDETPLYDPQKVRTATRLTPLQLNAIHLGDRHSPVLPPEK